MTDIIEIYKSKYPNHKFRLSSTGKVQRFYPNNKKLKWKNVCPHNRTKTACKECGGSSFCEHGRMNYRCKDCKGVAICKNPFQDYKNSINLNIKR
jgi:tRNA(Ile2) C34 agmatinyltransferase TiaS